MSRWAVVLIALLSVAPVGCRHHREHTTVERPILEASIPRLPSPQPEPLPQERFRHVKAELADVADEVLVLVGQIERLEDKRTRAAVARDLRSAIFEELLGTAAHRGQQQIMLALTKRLRPRLLVVMQRTGILTTAASIVASSIRIRDEVELGRLKREQASELRALREGLLEEVLLTLLELQEYALERAEAAEQIAAEAPELHEEVQGARDDHHPLGARVAEILGQ